MGEASSNSSTESLFAHFLNKKSKNKPVAKRSCLTSKDSNKPKPEKSNTDSQNANDTGTNSVLKTENCEKESTFVNSQANALGDMELPFEDNFIVFENVTAPGSRKTIPIRKKSEMLVQVALACTISRGKEDCAKSDLQTATTCSSTVDKPCKRRRCRNRLPQNYAIRNDSNPPPEMTNDQRQRIQSFIESIKPEFWSPFTDNVNNSMIVTSTPNANAARRSNVARGSNVENFLDDSVESFNFIPDPITENTSVVVDISSQENSTTVSQNKEEHVLINTSDVASISANTKVNNSTVDTEDTIMSYVDSLIASEEQDINREVDERFDRFIENQRTACDSLRSITEIHNVFEDEVVVDNSVEIVSVSSPPRPILSVTDDDVVFISSNEVNWEGLQDFDVPVVARNSRRRKPQTHRVPVKRRRKNAPATETTTNPTEASVSDPISTLPDSNNAGQLTRECPICLEHLQINNISSTVCGHVFCTSCIKGAIKSSRTCPNCRTKLTLKKIHPLYL